MAKTGYGGAWMARDRNYQLQAQADQAAMKAQELQMRKEAQTENNRRYMEELTMRRDAIEYGKEQDRLKRLRADEAFEFEQEKFTEQGRRFGRQEERLDEAQRLQAEQDVIVNKRRQAELEVKQGALKLREREFGLKGQKDQKARSEAIDNSVRQLANSIPSGENRRPSEEMSGRYPDLIAIEDRNGTKVAIVENQRFPIPLERYMAEKAKGTARTIRGAQTALDPLKEEAAGRLGLARSASAKLKDDYYKKYHNIGLEGERAASEDQEMAIKRIYDVVADKFVMKDEKDARKIHSLINNYVADAVGGVEDEEEKQKRMQELVRKVNQGEFLQDLTGGLAKSIGQRLMPRALEQERIEMTSPVGGMVTEADKELSMSLVGSQLRPGVEGAKMSSYKIIEQVEEGAISAQAAQSALASLMSQRDSMPKEERHILKNTLFNLGMMAKNPNYTPFTVDEMMGVASLKDDEILDEDRIGNLLDSVAISSRNDWNRGGNSKVIKDYMSIITKASSYLSSAGIKDSDDNISNDLLEKRRIRDITANKLINELKSTRNKDVDVRSWMYDQVVNDLQGLPDNVSRFFKERENKKIIAKHASDVVFNELVRAHRNRDGYDDKDDVDINMDVLINERGYEDLETARQLMFTSWGDREIFSLDALNERAKNYAFSVEREGVAETPEEFAIETRERSLEGVKDIYSADSAMRDLTIKQAEQRDKDLEDVAQVTDRFLSNQRDMMANISHSTISEAIGLAGRKLFGEDKAPKTRAGVIDSTTNDLVNHFKENNLKNYNDKETLEEFILYSNRAMKGLKDTIKPKEEVGFMKSLKKMAGAGFLERGKRLFTGGEGEDLFGDDQKLRRTVLKRALGEYVKLAKKKLKGMGGKVSALNR